MAVQFHVAHSSEVNGAAIIAGCAYWCAAGNAEAALLCMKGDANVPALLLATEYAAALLSIDNTRNMENDKIWLFSGTEDTIVSTVE